jgi:hypothetical protein
MAPLGSVMFSAHRKHSQKICRACGGHLISMNFTPRNWEGYYACLLIKGGREIMPTIGVRTLSLLPSRHKNPPIHRPHDLHKFDSR